ncbi:lysine-sensitive aspartokinase 3 [Candidatus Woesearchaeota archaeon]|nr:lysine-sensitive aspartokinase 3 [Candidatus Woesearchaeota archaeon]
MIVMKFGGSSVKDSERMKEVANIVRLELAKKPVVVLSACKGITDKLIETANKANEGEDYSILADEITKLHYNIIKDFNLGNSLVDPILDEFFDLINKIKENNELNAEILDHVQSFGEMLSTRIFAAYFSSIGVSSRQFDAWRIGMITDSEFGGAEPLESAPKKIADALKKVKEVPIVTGFIGKDINGVITTLGRGGSDYTAAIIGAAINADEIQIWTDADGIMTADPRVVKNAKTNEKVSFAEASELAFFGAKVLHPKTILPAMNKNIPVRVLNTYNPKGKGTIIVKEANKSRDVIKAIACKKNITLVNINSTRMIDAHGFLAKVFDVFGDYGKSVDMIATSEVNVSLTVDDDKNLDKIIDELRGIADINVEKNKAIVCVVGEGMKHTPGIAGKTFTALGKNEVNIEMISQGASEINISFIVNNQEADKAVQVLHKEYFGS